MAGEKTERATDKRKKDERNKGNIFLSREIITIAALLSAFFGLKLLLPYIFDVLTKFLEKYFLMGSTQKSISVSNLNQFFFDGVMVFAQTALPLLMISITVNVVVTMAQTKMLFTVKAFEFKGSRINPISGIKKMFSLRSLVELIKSVLKITMLLVVIYLVLKDELALLPRLFDMEPMQAMIYVGGIIMRIVIPSGVIFFFLGVADYFYQWYEYEKNLRMSKQDIKDEYKQMEGDPHIKAQIRSLQQQRARQRMMQNVPDADVVIRNPTHYAVAIKYDQTRHRAPVVVAKGADEIALRIIAIAEENDVYVTENRPLARALFETVELDAEISGEHYQAIAEILAFIYKVRKKDKN